MGAFKDITGQKFGHLTALYQLHNYHKKGVYWLCVCECGNLTEVKGVSLREGHTKSCGCLKVKHKQYGTRLYNIYNKVKDRCYNRNNSNYKDYGGRHISMCDEWRNDFQAFYDWSMSNGYEDTLTIDRIDNDKGYSPNNCRWANMIQQNRNRRNNRNYTINCVTRSLPEWCEIYNRNYNTVSTRLYRGWSIEKSLELP